MNRFYKSLVASALLALGALSAQAYDFEEGGLYYAVSGATQIVTVTTGDNAYAGDIVIPATVEHDGVTYTVTGVGTTFKNNTAVTSLKLPATVTTLPESCFAGMTGLLEVEIPNVETLPNMLVDGCTSLTTLTLGEGVHWASYNMTRNCTALTKVYMLYADVVGWNCNLPVGTYSPPATKPISNIIQAQSTLYIPFGTTDAYKAKKNIGNGSVTLWNKFGAYVELDPPGGNVDVESITIAPENPVLAAEEGATVQLTATVLPDDATDKTIVWSTSDASIATVSNTGLVTRTAPLINDGDQPYTVTITATGANDVVATVTVTAEVLANIAVSSIAIEPENPVLAAEAGATVQLTATPLPENALDKTIAWSSADESVATVDQNGLVTRVAPLYNNDVPFTVDITATAASGVTQTVTVTAQVLETVLPTAIAIAPEAPVLAAESGSTVQLTVNYTPDNTTDRVVTWSSADEAIATVDQNGLVTRTAPLTSDDEQPYTVVITATTPNGLTANVTVTANVKGDEFFCEDGIYYNVLSADDLTVEVTNSLGGTAAEADCYSGEIEIPATVTHKNRTYRVISIGNYAFAENTLVTKLTLNEGLQSIDSYGVRGMTGINELVLPQSTTTLDAFCFTRMGVESFTIPNVAILPMSLMANCPNLKHIVLGEGVKILNNNMTNNVTTVEDVTCLATTPPIWEGSVATFAPFKNFISTATLYVPEGCANAYRNIASNGIYYWRFGTIEEIVDQLPESTLAEALAANEGDEVRIGDELFIAVVETDGTAILTDNQGNWIGSNFGEDVRTALNYASSIEAGSLQGTLSNLDTNPTITLTKLPAAGQSAEVAQPLVVDMVNEYVRVPGNCLAEVTGYYEGDQIWAFSDPNYTGQTLDLDKTYIGNALDSYLGQHVRLTCIMRLKEAWEPEEQPTDGEGGQAPRRVHKSDLNSASNYIITPTTGSASGEITTAIADVKAGDADTVSVTYVSATGQRSSRPMQGVNIVVTRHADGTTTTTKLIK